MAYEESALAAVKYVTQKTILPQQAWEHAVNIEFPHSISSQQKSCPKNTFLGLCGEGIVKGIGAGNYTKSSLNKHYAITAIKILSTQKKAALTPLELWEQVLQKLNADRNKQHNSQMNVVLALWQNNLIDN